MNQRALSSISAAVVLHNENDDTAQYDGSFFFCQMNISTPIMNFFKQMKRLNVFLSNQSNSHTYELSMQNNEFQQ